MKFLKVEKGGVLRGGEDQFTSKTTSAVSGTFVVIMRKKEYAGLSSIVKLVAGLPGKLIVHPRADCDIVPPEARLHAPRTMLGNSHKEINGRKKLTLRSR